MACIKQGCDLAHRVPESLVKWAVSALLFSADQSLKGLEAHAQLPSHQPVSLSKMSVGEITG